MFPYHVTEGTILFLGLYINSHLVSAYNYTISSAYRSPASLAGTVQGDSANFTYSMMTFTVTAQNLKTLIPALTTITVTLWTSHGIWVQFDSTPVTSSYESLGVLSGIPSATIADASEVVAPHTISVGVYSDAA